VNIAPSIDGYYLVSFLQNYVRLLKFYFLVFANINQHFISMSKEKEGKDKLSKKAQT